MTNKRFTGTDLEEYDPRFVRCRGLRSHTWQFKTDWNVTTGPRGKVIEFTRTLHCVGCTTDRIETYTVTKSGRFQRRGTPQYKYADGYQVSRGNPIETDEVRDRLLHMELAESLDKELLNRLLNMRPEARTQIEEAGKALAAKDKKALRAVS